MIRRSLLIPLISASLGAQAAPAITLVPSVRIESSDSTGVARFGTATFATVLGNGEIAVADGADGTVRIFGPDAVERRRLGRQGRGPGEFASLGWLGRYGRDSLLVWDFVLGRMTVLHQATGPARSVSVEAMRGASLLAGSPQGELALSTPLRRTDASRPMATAVTPAGVAYRIWRDTVDIRTIDLEGRTMRLLANALRRESIIGTLADGRRAGLARPLGPVTAVAFRGDLMVVAATDGGTVTAVDSRGAVQHRFTVPTADAEPTPRQYARAIEELMLGYPPGFREQAALVAGAVPAPSEQPQFSAMLADPRGNIWFVRTPAGAPTTRLTVHTMAGELVATIDVPFKLTVFEVGGDHLVGRIEDADGAQAVVLFRFSPPDSGR